MDMHDHMRLAGVSSALARDVVRPKTQKEKPRNQATHSRVPDTQIACDTSAAHMSRHEMCGDLLHANRH